MYTKKFSFDNLGKVDYKGSAVVAEILAYEYRSVCSLFRKTPILVLCVCPCRSIAS